MTIDEAIKHAEEVAEENSKSYEEWLACKNRGNVGWSKSDIEAVDKSIEQCKKCAEEHRQLVEWLKELKAHRSAWKKLKNDIVAYHNNYDYNTAMHFLNTVVGLCTDIYDDTDAGGDADASNN